MIDLLYLSHTAIPAHLTELEGLDLIEPDEHVLIALDGVLLDGLGRRVSGPTLHDYCLLTSTRVLLWARDYGRHLCYAFPLTEISVVEGVGLDPLHAHMHLAFSSPGEEEQHFTLTLLPLADLSVAVTSFRLAADTAQALAAQGIETIEASAEIVARISEHIFGATDTESPPDTPYRWPGANPSPPQSGASPSLQQDPSSLPPEKIYSVSRMGRAAWDTVNRALREAEVPFNLNGNDLRDMADALRALNDLLTTVAGNPGARDVVMAFLKRRSGAANSSESETGPPPHRSAPHTATSNARNGDDPATEASHASDYHEIPLRRRTESTPGVLQPSSTPLASERGDTIPLRRRGGERRS